MLTIFKLFQIKIKQYIYIYYLALRATKYILFDSLRIGGINRTGENHGKLFPSNVILFPSGAIRRRVSPDC